MILTETYDRVFFYRWSWAGRGSSRDEAAGWLLAAHPLRCRRVHAGSGVGRRLLGVDVPAEVGVEAAGLELPVLLAERAGLAAEVDAAVAAADVGEAELRAHLGAVRAGVDPLAPREAGQHRVDGARGAARRRAAVHDLRDPTERDARAPARQAACCIACMQTTVLISNSRGGSGMQEEDLSEKRRQKLAAATTSIAYRGRSRRSRRRGRRTTRWPRRGRGWRWGRRSPAAPSRPQARWLRRRWAWPDTF